MLALSRNADEWIDLILPDGRTISVGVTEILRARVRLAFDAPKDVVIHRREVMKKIAASVRDSYVPRAK